nr:hypothetical protein [uncultured Bdellovibrio sp.]
MRHFHNIIVAALVFTLTGCGGSSVKNPSTPSPVPLPPGPLGVFNPQGTWSLDGANPNVEVVIGAKNFNAPLDQLPNEVPFKKPIGNIDIEYLQDKATARFGLIDLGFKNNPVEVVLQPVSQNFQGTSLAEVNSDSIDSKYGCLLQMTSQLKADFSSSDTGVFIFTKTIELKDSGTGANCQTYLQDQQKLANAGQKIGPLQLLLDKQWITVAELTTVSKIVFITPMSWKRVSTEMQSLPSCTSSQVIQRSPIETEYFEGLIPVGGSRQGGHLFPTSHVYFYHNQSHYALLISPLNGRITEAILTRRAPKDEATGQPKKNPDGTMAFDFHDYQLMLQNCSDIIVHFAHVHNLYLENPKLQSLQDQNFDKGQCDEPYLEGSAFFVNCHLKVNIPVTTMDVLGSFQNPNGAIALDMTTLDMKAPTSFINPSRHNSWDTHAVCPADYAVPGLGNLFNLRFSDYTGKQKSIANDADKTQGKGRCGTVSMDMEGTVRGYWFWAESTGKEFENFGLHTVLTWNVLDPKLQVFSIGTKGPEGANGNWGFYINSEIADANINVPFEKTKPDVLYCYDTKGTSTVDLNGLIGSPLTIIMKFTGAGVASTMTLGSRPEKCQDAPVVMPANAVNYIR